jgi:hypothetical protein
MANMGHVVRTKTSVPGINRKLKKAPSETTSRANCPAFDGMRAEHTFRSTILKALPIVVLELADDWLSNSSGDDSEIRNVV